MPLPVCAHASTSRPFHRRRDRIGLHRRRSGEAELAYALDQARVEMKTVERQWKLLWIDRGSAPDPGSQARRARLARSLGPDADDDAERAPHPRNDSGNRGGRLFRGRWLPDDARRRGWYLPPGGRSRRRGRAALRTGRAPSLQRPARQFAWMMRQPARTPQCPWVLFLHGNARHRRQPRQHRPLRAPAIPWRQRLRPGVSRLRRPRREPTESSVTADARLGYRYLRDTLARAVPSRIVIYGWSLGSAIAVNVASTVDIRRGHSRRRAGLAGGDRRSASTRGCRSGWSCATPSSRSKRSDRITRRRSCSFTARKTPMIPIDEGRALFGAAPATEELRRGPRRPHRSGGRRRRAACSEPSATFLSDIGLASIPDRTSNAEPLNREPLVLRIPGRSLHFLDLQRVALAVAADQKHPLVRVERLQHRMRRRMRPQVLFRRLHEFDRLVAGRVEILDQRILASATC